MVNPDVLRVPRREGLDHWSNSDGAAPAAQKRRSQTVVPGWRPAPGNRVPALAPLVRVACPLASADRLLLAGDNTVLGVAVIAPPITNRHHMPRCL
jgi:hypothetical protein